MKVMISIQHPAHVHFFKNSIFELQDKGHEVLVVARKKELVEVLLNEYDIPHRLLAGAANSVFQLLKTQLVYEIRILAHAQSFKPDIMLSIGEPAIAHAGKILDIPTVLFSDTEHATISNKLAFPFADYVCTPDAFTNELGENHITYPGYHELAYLHPNHYQPDPDICIENGIDLDRDIVVIRLVSWKAAHDIGHHGIDDLQNLIQQIESEGAQIVITSEGELPPDMEQYQMTVPPHRIHDLLYYADVFVGESGTMAIESAVLGTPAIFVSTLEAGVLDELSSKYHLLMLVSDMQDAAELGNLIINQLNRSHSEEESKRKNLLNDSVDTTSVILHQVLKQ